MPGDFVITGGEDLVKLSKALKACGELEQRKQYTREVKKVVRDKTVPKLRTVLREEYPARGGLAARAAKAPMTVALRTGATGGLAIRIRGLEIKLGELYGKFRHPVFANPAKTRREWRWVDQPAPAHLLHETVRDSVGSLMPELSRVYREHVEHVLITRGPHRG